MVEFELGLVLVVLVMVWRTLVRVNQNLYQIGMRNEHSD